MVVIIAWLISPLSGKTNKNSGHFINIINGICLDSNDMLISFDVSSLITNVPIGEAVMVIKEMLLPWTRGQNCH